MTALLLLLISGLASLLLVVAPAWAGPVSWQEVPATASGRQWWDAGSLRWTQDGHLRLLSRYQPSAKDEEVKPSSQLYVMEVDCQQHLYRDVAINGLPRFGAPWQLAAADDLTAVVIDQACLAAPPQA